VSIAHIGGDKPLILCQEERRRPGWQDAVVFVQPHIVMARQQRFRHPWRRLSQRGQPGRPVLAQEVCKLSQDM
jgi:hypothetical protein